MAKLPERPHNPDYSSLRRETANPEPTAGYAEPTRPTAVPSQSNARMPGPGEPPAFSVTARDAGLAQFDQLQPDIDQQQSETDKFLEESKQLNADALRHENNENLMEPKKTKEDK